jgi:hypothetical protein
MPKIRGAPAVELRARTSYGDERTDGEETGSEGASR